MILKVLGIIFIIFSCISIGWIYMEKENERLLLLKEFRKMCMLLKGVVRYSGQDLVEAINDVSEKLDVRIKEFMNELVLEMKKMDGKLFNSIWKEKVCDKFNNCSLKEKDKEIIIKTGDILGYLDKELQIENFEQYITEFNGIISDLEKEIAEKNKLYKTLSVGAAIFIVIIFLN